MSNTKTSLEIIAPTVEEAITRGAEELGLSEEDLDVLVLDEGKGGFLGLGTRQARVRLTIRGTGTQMPGPEFEPRAEEAISTARETPAAQKAEDCSLELTITEMSLSASA